MASDTLLRAKLIRLAHMHPEFRNDLLPLLKEAAGFPADSIGEQVKGPEGVPGSDAKKPWSKGEFTQVENVELDEKQEKGQLSDGKADVAKTAAGQYVLHVEKGKYRGSYKFDSPEEAVSASGDHGDYSDKEKAEGLKLLHDGKPWSVKSTAGSFTIRPPKGGKSASADDFAVKAFRAARVAGKSQDEAVAIAKKAKAAWKA